MIQDVVYSRNIRQICNLSLGSRCPKAWRTGSRILLYIAVLFLAMIPGCYAQSSLSLNKPASAFTSDSGHGPALANDGTATNTSYWSAPMAPNQNAWWQVDLGSTYQISSVNVRNWVGGSRYYQYRVRGSLDGVNWFPLAVKSSTSVAVNGGDTFSVNAIARYVRVNGYYNSANNSFHLSNVAVYGTAASAPSPSPVALSNCLTAQGKVTPGQAATFSCTLQNTSASTITLSNVNALIDGLTDPLAPISSTSLASSIILLPGGSYTIANASLPTISTNGAYAITLQYSLGGGPQDAYATFFQVRSASDLTSYAIAQTNYNGLPVYLLDGGMSAEYGVVKSAEVLAQSTSGSWTTASAGQGPRAVYATPHFLQSAIAQTIATYDAIIGANTPLTTVVVGVEPASPAYLVRTMKAAFLPSHFLVSSNTVQEVATVLDQASADGYAAYATQGYDQSVATVAVTWIKLTQMPPEYTAFLQRHNVQNVVLIGTTGNSLQTGAKVLRTGASPTGLNPGDALIAYPDGFDQTDITENNNRIRDYIDWPLASQTTIADWESGLSQPQVTGLVADAKATGASVDLVTSNNDTLALYDLATYVTLSFMQKNATVFNANGGIRGIALNPYLIAHTIYESKIGYIPEPFWQFTSVSSTIDQRLLGTVKNAIAYYFPGTNFDSLHIWVNCTHNFGASFTANNLISELQTKAPLNPIDQNNYSIDEVWNLADGFNSPVEISASNITTYSSYSALQAWDNSLTPLTLSDIEAIPSQLTTVSITRQ